jgi:hypothetical protein
MMRGVCGFGAMTPIGSWGMALDTMIVNHSRCGRQLGLNGTRHVSSVFALCLVK